MRLFISFQRRSSEKRLSIPYGAGRVLRGVIIAADIRYRELHDKRRVLREAPGEGRRRLGAGFRVQPEYRRENLSRQGA